MKTSIRIGIKKGKKIYNITSIYLLSDGSFKVDIPYCKFNKGTIIKAISDYGGGFHETQIQQEFSVNNRPQLSIHTSGFIQFSGKNIISGIDKNTGKIKGAGLNSNPLCNPIISGPTFGIEVWGLENGYESTSTEKQFDIVFEESDFILRQLNSSNKVYNTYLIEGWILPPNEKLEPLCVRKENGREKITLSFPQYIHSPGAIFTLDIIRLKNHKSFIALAPFQIYTGFPQKYPFGFILGAPSEQSKENSKKRIIMNALSFENFITKDLSSLDFIPK